MSLNSAEEYLIHRSSDGVGMHNVHQYVKNSFQELCSVKMLKRRIPIIEWLPKYKINLLIQDMIAGISVGLTAIPQGIAYAGVAGLPLEYGLYSGFMGCFVYLFMGSCKDLTIGPTAIVALMTQKYVHGYNADFAVLLTFLSGCIVFLFGVFNLGFLIEFISMPVIIGFTTSAAITIGFTQLHSLLGFSGHSDTFLDVCVNFVKNYRSVKLWDSVLGVFTIIFLLLLRKLSKYGSRTNRPNASVFKNCLYKLNWFISLARNAIVVILGCLIAWILNENGLTPFTLTGNIGNGLPPFAPPPFHTTINNKTYYFIDMVQELNISILMIALISILEAVAIAKAFANGKLVDATQEMLALGACSIFGSFVRSMPTTGSFTRTAVNNASGVQTTMGGIFTGTLVLMALSLLTSTFYFIPKAVLAGLIICAMIYMVEFDIILLLWRSKRVELLPFFITLLCCLFVGLEIGIIAGICFNIIMILAVVSRPKIEIKNIQVKNKNVAIITPRNNLLYCSADHFSRNVLQTSLINSYEDMPNIIIIDGSNVRNIDTTVAKSINILIETMKIQERNIYLWKFHSCVRNICMGVHPEINSHFIDDDSIENIIEGESLNNIKTDGQ